MAEPVSYNTDDLHREIAQLYLECKVRAAREDALLAKIGVLEGELARLKPVAVKKED